MHCRLMLSQTISDPLSFLLNMLPTRKPRSRGESTGQLYAESCMNLITYITLSFRLLRPLASGKDS
ncbi:hypothetical protein BCV72DRAFT_323699 [Rhizopus microsporus var. microsporus]|uniref:Uncharacterized protein n=1 Tax=Rhizopus microsporus var. microsporus TaxID=86635 RepID=A0A1X0QMK3_RHIZD|nr:hypothetical protein BCV72DRAFT_323699 [Rhizopus microsporus var. microsporus]